MKTPLIDYLMFANGMILLFNSLVQLGYKRKAFTNYITILFYSLVGFMLLYNWSFRTGFIYNYPLLINIDIVVSYMVFPGVLLYFHSITNTSTKPFLHYFPYFIPALLVLAFVFIFNATHPDYAAAYFSTNPKFPPYLQPSLPSTINTLGDVLGVLVFIIAIWQNRALLVQKDLYKSFELRFVFLIYFLMMVNSALLLYAHLIHNLNFMLIPLNGYGVLLIGYAVFSYRYPDSLQIVLRVATSMRYEKTRLQKLPVNLIISRLDKLMTADKLFVNEKLSLNQLSSMLNITSHQLSELLNQHYKMNFRRYINSLRVREAKDLLVRQKNMRILEVAFACGFSSKTTFNVVFAEFVNCTPREYRQQISPLPNT